MALIGQWQLLANFRHWVNNYVDFHSQTGSYALRSNRQATELGQTFRTLVSVVTNYILQATNAVKVWEGGYERVGSLALKWQKGSPEILSTICLSMRFWSAGYQSVVMCKHTGSSAMWASYSTCSISVGTMWYALHHCLLCHHDQVIKLDVQIWILDV